MINDARLAIGKGSIGFINPAVRTPVIKYKVLSNFYLLPRRSTLQTLLPPSMTLLRAVTPVAIQRVSIRRLVGILLLVWAHPISPSYLSYGRGYLRRN